MAEKCPDEYRELTYQEIEEKILQLAVCGKDALARRIAKIESGAAYSKRDAERQIAKETNKPLSTIRQAIRREEQKINLDTMYPVCEIREQAQEHLSRIPHVAQNTGNNEWYTPPAYIEAAREVMGIIDLDPASSDVANKTVKAVKYYTAENDGRKMKWEGKIWLNPPYSSDLINHFTYLLCLHFKNDDVTEAIVLVNNATETEWFGRLIEIASAVVFPKTRIKFLDPQCNPIGAPLQGQAVVYLGKNSNLFLKVFSKFGWAAKIWKSE